MKQRNIILVAGALVAALSFGAEQVLSQESGGKRTEKHGEKPGGNPQADMQAMMKLQEPGPHHQHLQALVGEWEVASKFWMDPAQPPQESKAKARFHAIHGGRFIVQDYEGTFAEHPFVGLGMMGYDNAKQKHVSLWTDSTSTSLYTEEGTCDGACKVVTEVGESMCGTEKMKMKSVMKITDADHFSLEMYAIAPTGEEMKNMELHYTRKK